MGNKNPALATRCPPTPTPRASRISQVTVRAPPLVHPWCTGQYVLSNNHGWLARRRHEVLRYEGHFIKNWPTGLLKHKRYYLCQRRILLARLFNQVHRSCSQVPDLLLYSAEAFDRFGRCGCCRSVWRVSHSHLRPRGRYRFGTETRGALMAAKWPRTHMTHACCQS